MIVDFICYTSESQTSYSLILKAINKLPGLKVRGMFSKEGYPVCKFYINQVVCSSLGGSSGSRGNMQQMARE